MADAHVDHPGETTWFAGHGPRRPLGLACDHPCDHDWTLITVGWGPDYRRYSVVECTECSCRAWTAEYPPPHTAEHPKFRLGPLMQMSAAARTDS